MGSGNVGTVTISFRLLLSLSPEFASIRRTSATHHHLLIVGGTPYCMLLITR